MKPLIFISHSLFRNAFNKNTSFGQYVDMFVSTAQSKTHDDPLKLASEVRQFMTGVKHHLFDAGQKELTEIMLRSSDVGNLQDINLRAVVEAALHKVVLKPLKPTIYKSFVDKYTR